MKHRPHALCAPLPGARTTPQILLACALGLAGGAQAATVNITSAGNYATIANHTACTTSPSSLCADFSASDNVTGTFTTAGPLPANASDLEIGATVVSYSLFSGLDTIASTNADARLNTLRISTDAAGNITGVNLLHAVLWQTGSVPHSTADRFAAITLVPGNNGVSTRNSGCTTVGTGDSGIADTCLVATITDASRSTAYNAPVAVSMAPVPSAPQNPAATAGNGQATVSWNEPASGGPFTLYTVTSVEDPSKSCTATSPATSCVVPNLANGTPYTFTVRASNASGMGAASTATAPVTPATPTPTPNGPAPIPTLSEWALLALSSLLALAAVFTRRRPG